MNTVKSNRRACGFTLVEMLVVIASIGLLAALLLPVLAQTKARARRIECVGDLREIGLACHVFANDHGGKYPTQVSTNDGGALEFVAAGYGSSGDFYFSFSYLYPLSGALATPKLFACPADLERPAATNFSQFNNLNFSFDVGLAGNANDPRWLLAADRGLPAGRTIADTIRHVPAPFPSRWSGAHAPGGNILFADGHVELSSSATMGSEGIVPEDVVYPSIKGTVLSSSAGGGGGGGGGSSATSPGQSGAMAPSGMAGRNIVTNQLGATNPAAAAPRPTTQTGPIPSISDRPSASRSHQNIGGVASRQSESEISNSTPEVAAPLTNAPGSRVASPAGDDSMMSPFNRELAAILREFIFGTYFLILFLFLLFAAYRVWRWTQNPKRQRRR